METLRVRLRRGWEINPAGIYTYRIKSHFPFPFTANFSYVRTFLGGELALQDSLDIGLLEILTSRFASVNYQGVTNYFSENVREQYRDVTQGAITHKILFDFIQRPTPADAQHFNNRGLPIPVETIELELKIWPHIENPDLSQLPSRLIIPVGREIFENAPSWPEIV